MQTESWNCVNCSSNNSVEAQICYGCGALYSITLDDPSNHQSPEEISKRRIVKSRFKKKVNIDNFHDSNQQTINQNDVSSSSLSSSSSSCSSSSSSSSSCSVLHVQEGQVNEINEIISKLCSIIL